MGWIKELLHKDIYKENKKVNKEIHKQPPIGSKKQKKTELRFYLDDNDLNWIYHYTRNRNLKISRFIRDLVKMYRKGIENG